MARLNFRLTCSLLAVGIVAFLAFLPSTRTLVQRQLWILTGKYEERVLPDQDTFFATNGMVNDDRVLILLTGYNRMPAESRAIELMKIAAVRKDPALWAHTVRQTAMAPVPTPDSRKNETKVDRIRIEAIGHIQLIAAEEGAKLDPDNVFFDLAKATAFAKLGQWEKIAPTLIAAGHRKKYDDYVFDELKRRTEGLQAHLHPVLDSELGEAWSSILLPHLANFKALTRCFGVIPDPRTRYAAALGLARAGRMMLGNQGSYIAKLVGFSLVLGSGYRVVGQEPKKDLTPVLGTLVSRTEALGDKKTADGWRAFKDWKWTPAADFYPSDIPNGSHAMTGVYGLYLLIVFAAIAAAAWLGMQVEPSASNVMVLGCLLLGVELLSCFVVERFDLLFAMLLAGNLLFVSFLLIRLPGKAKLGWTLALIGSALAATASLSYSEGELFIGLMFLWGIPFGFSSWLRRAAPRWVGIVLATIFFGLAFVFLSSVSAGDPVRFGKYLVESTTTMMALAAFWIPALAATVMSITKTTLPEALKQIAWPLPLAVLASAVIFAWGTRDMSQWEKAWQEITRRELPAEYQKVISNIRNSGT